MPSAIQIAGDIAASAVALSGLIFVFIGMISTSFSSYQKAEQAAVRARYQQRVWFSFVGFVLALLSAFLALVGKWFASECAAIAGVVLLLIALVWVLIAAILAAREIR